MHRVQYVLPRCGPRRAPSAFATAASRKKSFAPASAAKAGLFGGAGRRQGRDRDARAQRSENTAAYSSDVPAQIEITSCGAIPRATTLRQRGPSVRRLGVAECAAILKQRRALRLAAACPRIRSERVPNRIQQRFRQVSSFRFKPCVNTAPSSSIARRAKARMLASRSALPVSTVITASTGPQTADTGTSGRISVAVAVRAARAGFAQSPGRAEIGSHPPREQLCSFRRGGCSPCPARSRPNSAERPAPV